MAGLTKNNFDGRELILKTLCTLAAAGAILAVLLICLFLIAEGLPAIFEIGIADFLTGTVWRPANELFGILPMIAGSICVTALAVIFGVPLAIFAAVYLAFYVPRRLYGSFTAGVNLLAGIPSVVYGFFGLIFVVPLVKNIFNLASGSNLLTAAIILGIMILPTVIGVALPAIKSVPRGIYEGALALGASKERAIYFTVLPAAKSGIMAGIVLGIGRAIGETMAVIMVAGNQVRLPGGIFDGVRTMTANIVLEMGYAAGLHREALIATGVILFIFILGINIAVSLGYRRRPC